MEAKSCVKSNLFGLALENLCGLWQNSGSHVYSFVGTGFSGMWVCIGKADRKRAFWNGSMWLKIKLFYRLDLMVRFFTFARSLKK